MKSAAETLDAAAARLGGGDRRSPEIDPLLDRLLRPAYSMISERRVHDTFTGGAGEAASIRASRRASAGEGEAILF